MEARLQELEKKFEDFEMHEENIKNIVLEQVKKKFEEWLHNTLTISCISEEIERRYKSTKTDIAESSKAFHKLECKVEDVKDQINLNFTDICKLKNFVDDIVTDLKLKAYHGDVQRLDRVLEEKCPWEYAIGIMKSLGDLAKISQLKVLEKHLEVFKGKVAEEYLLKDQAKVLLKNSKKKVKNLLEKYATKEEVQEDFKKIYLKIDEVNGEVKELRRIEEIRDNERQKDNLRIKIDLADNVKTYQLERLRRDVEAKASKIELERFMGENMPKITEFTLEFKKIKKTMEKQESALLRLDEIILNKASKADMIHLRESFSDLPSSRQLEKLNQLSNSLLELQKNVKFFSEDFLDLKTDLQVTPKKISLENDLKLLKNQVQDLENRVSYKAETLEMLVHLEKKASWGDFSHLADSIEAVHQQTRLLASHISLLLPQKKSLRASSHCKIAKKLVDLVISSKPTFEDTPTSHLKLYSKHSNLSDNIKSRCNTPHTRLQNASLSPFHI